MARQKIEIPDLDLLSDEEFEHIQKELESKTLMASDDMAEELHELGLFLRQDTIDQGFMGPRFGVLTLKSRHAPMYVFNKPELKEKFAKSFNDGKHIFINEDWMRSVLDDQGDPERPWLPLLPYILHHLTHMIMNHHKRFKVYPPEIIQLGTDLWTYCKLKLAYPDLQWPAIIEKDFLGYGLSKTQMQEIAKKSEDTILAELWARYKNMFTDEEPSLNDQKSSTHNDDPSQEKNNSNDNTQNKQQSEENSQENEETNQAEDADNGQGKSAREQAHGPLDPQKMKKALSQMGVKATESQIEESAEQDFMEMKDAAQALEEAGSDLTLERMDYPELDDEEGFKAQEEELRVRDLEDIVKSQQIAGQKGGRGKDGLSDAAHEEAKKETEGKISWKLALQETLGESMNYNYSEVEAGALYYVDPVDMGLDMEIFIGTDLPHKKEGSVLVLMDTSGSVTEDFLSMFLAEISGILKNQNPDSDQATEVLLFFADDMIKSKPVVLTPENLEEMMENPMKLYGRGGTDLGGSLRAVKKLDLLKEKKINAIVYFTDLEDTPPKKSDAPEGIPLLFVAPETAGQEEFIRAVKGFARVCPIAEVEVDLTAGVSNTQEIRRLRR